MSVPLTVRPYAPGGEQNAPGCTPVACAGLWVVLWGVGLWVALRGAGALVGRSVGDRAAEVSIATGLGVSVAIAAAILLEPAALGVALPPQPPVSKTRPVHAAAINVLPGVIRSVSRAGTGRETCW
jgi:hypothetical protein